MCRWLSISTTPSVQLKDEYMKKLFCCILAVALILSSVCGCALSQKVTDEMFALDTIISFTIYDTDINHAKDTIGKLKSEITRLENLLSATKKGTDIYNINNSDGKSVTVSSETATLLKNALDISKSCDGAFDVSIYPVVKLWGFDTKEYRVPTDAEISKTIQNVDYRNVLVEDNKVTLKKGMSIDLGGVAKGYIGDCLYSIMKQQKIQSGLVNLGGMIILYKNNNDTDNFTLGVEYPDTSEVFATFNTSTEFTVTSGAYQRYFEEDGEVYHHIIDPNTGKSAQSDISSITVLGSNGLENDALSTAFYVMGVEKTLDYIKTHKNSSAQMYSIIMLNDDKTKLYVTADLVDNGFKLEKKFEDEITTSVINISV